MPERTGSKPSARTIFGRSWPPSGPEQLQSRTLSVRLSPPLSKMTWSHPVTPCGDFLPPGGDDTIALPPETGYTGALTLVEKAAVRGG